MCYELMCPVIKGNSHLMLQLIYIPALQCGTICVNPKRMTFHFDLEKQ